MAAPNKGRKFIAVDLDGTLAKYDKWQGRLHIGAPISPMVERVKKWLAEGHVVLIFTSRVADPTRQDHLEVVEAIETWCQKHIGERLVPTAIKQPYFREIWDDCARGVIPNSGIPCCQENPATHA